MYEIVDKQSVGPAVTQYEIKAPRIAKMRQPGQFIMARPQPHSERIPLTVADVNRDAGTITLIVQSIGKSTTEMAEMNVGDSFQDVAGPLGQPSHLDNYGTVVVVGGGVGTAVVYPQAVALRELGNKIITIIGARNKDLLIMEDKLAPVSDKLIITTDDGSAGMKGLVTNALQELIDDPDTNIGAVYCAGPVIMMKFVAALAKKHDIPAVVSLNPIMVDGTGMCGGCRVTVDGHVKFACVDGPEFDGHNVNYDELMDRLNTYKEHEARTLTKHQEPHKCRLNP
jgi:NAD(P)H-flavin reductase